MSIAMAKLLFALVGLLFIFGTAYTEPSQYCNFMSGRDHPGTNDFYMAVATYRNQSSKLHDLHIAFHVFRPQESALGWTAIGIGSGMAQSLTFIVYGDPRSGLGPVVSVHRAIGHWEPSKFDTTANGGKIQISLLNATWSPTPVGSSSTDPVMGARITLVCYSCDSGLDRDLEPILSVSAQFQPWIWAKNSEQRLAEYSEDSTLEMHSLKWGWGRFLMNMAPTIGSASEGPSPPTIKPGIKAIGVSETKGQSAPPRKHGFPPSSHTAKAALHGFFMALAFLLLLPCGVLAMVSSSPSTAFRLHWIMQLSAIACIAVGLPLGLLLRDRLDAAHQMLGLATVVAVGAQATMGFCHHVQFLRVPRRTWISHAHVYLGRAVLVAGHCSVLTGLLLHDSPIFQYVITGIIALAEEGWIIGTILWARRKLAWETEDCSSRSDTYQLLKEEDQADTDSRST